MSYLSKRTFFQFSLLAGIIGLAITGSAGLSQQQAPTIKIADNSQKLPVSILNTANVIDLPSTQRLDAMQLAMLAEIAWDRQQIEQAIAFYSAALQLEPNADLAARATEVSLMGDSFPDALIAAETWATLAPTNEHAQATTLILLIKANDPKGMQPFIQHLLKLDRDVMADSILLISSQLDGAAEHRVFYTAINQYSQGRQLNDALRYALALTSAKNYEIAAAIQQLEPVITQATPWQKALVLYFDLLQTAGKSEQALTLLQKQVTVSPNDPQLRMMLARQLIGQHAFSEALQHLKLLEQTTAYREQAQLFQAIINLELRNYDAAATMLQQITTTNPYSSAANYYLGHIYENKKQVAEAIAHYQKVELGPYYLNAQVSIAILTAATNQLSEALAHIHHLLVSYPQYSKELTLTSIQILLNANENDHAKSLLEQELAKTPNDVDLLYAGSLVAAKANDFTAAEADLQLVITLDPQHAEALNALGFILADQNNRLEEARGYIERAYTIDPNNPSILDSMGWVYYRLGKYDDALKYLKKAHAIAQDSEIAAHLGEVLWVSGHNDRAVKVLEEALALHPNNAVLLEIIGRFRSELLANNPQR